MAQGHPRYKGDVDILPPPGSSSPIGNTGNRRSRWKLTSRLGYAGRRSALFVSKCSMDANIAARFVYRRIQSPVGTARVPARACGPVGVSSPLRRSPQAFFSSGRHAECCTRLFLVFSQREWKAAPRRWYHRLVRRLLLISDLFSIAPLFQNHLLKLENFFGLKRDLKRDTRD
ncbi:unnamed protein product [Sphagnum troendelagicum]